MLTILATLGSTEITHAQSLLCSLTSIVTGQNSTACGAQSIVTGDYGLVSGYLSSVTGNNSTAVGAYSLAGGNNAVALGAHATAANAAPFLGTSNATALGAYSTAGVGGFAGGAFANASGASATALGLNAAATATGSVALGSNSIATIANTVSVGSIGNERRIVNVAAGAISASSTDAINGSQFSALSATVNGNSADILANTTAITLVNGRFALGSAQVAASLGGGSAVNGSGYVTAPNYAVLGGTYNNVGGALAAISARVDANSTAITAIGTGNGSSGLVIQDPTSKVISIGSTAPGTSINVAGSDGARQITGIAAGTLSNTSADAVTGAQLFTTNTALAAQTTRLVTNSAALASAFGGGAQFQPNGTFVNPTYTVMGSNYTSVGDALQAMDTALAVTRGTTIQNSNAISQINANITNNATTRLRYASINGTGNDASATGQNAVAFGSGSRSAGSASVAIGNDSMASRDNSIAVGNSSRATGVNAIAIGMGAVATGSVAIGVGAQASNGGAALGDEAVATGIDSAGLGPKSRATGRNAVAIGAGSVASEDNIVSMGATGNERRITNVAAGVNQTDAVNMSQLSDLNTRFASTIARVDSDLSKIRGGVAMAMAMSGGALPGDARVGVSVNVGTYGGQTALGVSHYVRLNNSVVLSGSVGLQDRQIGGRAGIMAAW